jgi:hypothetical protein
MKCVILFLLAGMITACNNASDGEVKKDSLLNDPVYHVPNEKGDTSSYERMPDKVTDSSEQ